MSLDQKAKELLNQATLYFLLAKRYEYVDPQKHMYFYQMHYNAAMELENYLFSGNHNMSHHDMPNQYSMY